MVVVSFFNGKTLKMLLKTLSIQITLVEKEITVLLNLITLFSEDRILLILKNTEKRMENILLE